MAKKRKKEEDSGGGGANWMDTYGDLVTLLLCFFVLLFSFSTIDAKKWETLVGALSGSNSIAIPVLTPEMAMEKPIDLIQQTDEEETEGEIVYDDAIAAQNLENFTALYSGVAEYIEENELSAEIIADFESYYLIIRFSDNVLFESARASLRQESYGTMDQVVNMLGKYDQLIHLIRIEGHTDNLPINNAQFSDNWDLSVARAVNVLRYFISTEKIDTKKITAAGYGEYHNVESNDTAEGRAVNRRVDFVLESLRVK